MKGQHLSDSDARFAVAQPESRDYVVKMIQNPPVLQSSLLNFITRLKDGPQVQIEDAIKIFQDMITRGCERNVITYSSLISACEKSGRWELALELFEEMHKDACKPNIVTYNALIAACGQGVLRFMLGSTPSSLPPLGIHQPCPASEEHCSKGMKLA